MKYSYKLSIILPVYNEKDSLSIMVKILEATLDFPNEIIVVYDDITDNTIDVAKEMQKVFSNIKLVYNDMGRGAQNAVRKGIEVSKSEIILITAVDEIFPIMAIKEMLELIEQQEQLEREKTKLKNLEIEVLDGLDLNTRKKRKKKRKRKSEITSGENILSFESKSGEPLEYDLDEILEKSEKFYEKEGIDWVEVPESIELDGEQRVEAIRIIEALCPTGDYENVTITYIPEGLADNEEKRRKLLEKTTEGYYTGDEEGKKDYWESDNFKERGGIEGIEDKETKGRLLITKTTKELKDDELFKQTLGKTAEELMGERGIMQETGLRGLGLSELLVIQRQRYNEDVEHMDEESWTWITEIEATPSSLVPDVDWASNDAQFYLHAFTPDYNFEHLGCRLAGSLKV